MCRFTGTFRIFAHVVHLAALLIHKRINETLKRNSILKMLNKKPLYRLQIRRATEVQF